MIADADQRRMALKTLIIDAPKDKNTREEGPETQRSVSVGEEEANGDRLNL